MTVIIDGMDQQNLMCHHWYKKQNQHIICIGYALISLDCMLSQQPHDSNLVIQVLSHILWKFREKLPNKNRYFIGFCALMVCCYVGFFVFYLGVCQFFYPLVYAEKFPTVMVQQIILSTLCLTNLRACPLMINLTLRCGT